ncbi:MAG: hypothetical protein L0Y56_02830, partial [Nitrospira sp.]|nr:hypothetical protein [Nitrospira sp.]
MTIYDFTQKELRERMVYFSPEGIDERGLRVVDVYTDVFLRRNPGALINLRLAQAMSIDDALLE